MDERGEEVGRGIPIEINGGRRMEKAAIYARLSSSGRYDFKDCVETIKAYGWKHVANFVDIAQDGYSFDRPEYQRMKRCINDGLVDNVIFPSFLDFTRDVSSALEEIEYAKERGATFYFCDIDISSDDIDVTSESFKKVLDSLLDGSIHKTFGQNDEVEDELHANKDHIEDYMDDFQVVDEKLFN